MGGSRCVCTCVLGRRHVEGGSELKGVKEMNEIRSHTALPTNSICGCVSVYVIGL